MRLHNALWLLLVTCCFFWLGVFDGLDLILHFLRLQPVAYIYVTRTVWPEPYVAKIKVFSPWWNHCVLAHLPNLHFDISSVMLIISIVNFHEAFRCLAGCARKQGEGLSRANLEEFEHQPNHPWQNQTMPRTYCLGQVVLSNSTLASGIA